MSNKVVQGFLEPAIGQLIEVDSPQWQQWLEENQGFRYEPKASIPGYGARKESNGFWYAFRKVEGKLHKKYLGNSQALTMERLERMAQEIVEPPKPRKKKVVQPSTQPVSTTNWVTDGELEALRREVEALRQEVRELAGKSLAHFAEEVNAVKQSLESEIEVLRNRLSQHEEWFKKADEVNEERNKLAQENWLLKSQLNNATAAPSVSKVKTDINQTVKVQKPIQKPACTHCNSTNTIGYGKDKKGHPRYRCNNCGKTFVLKETS